MKLNKTNLNKLAKTSIIYIDNNQYIFKSDTFQLSIDCELVDPVTMSIADRVTRRPIEEPETLIKGELVTMPVDIAKYLKFASTDEVRPILHAVNFDETSIVATDSYRLIEGKNDTGIDGIYDSYALSLVEPGAIGARAKVLTEEPKGKLKTFSKDILVFDDLIIYPTEGEYPNYKLLFPEGNLTEAMLCPLPTKINNPFSHRTGKVMFIEINKDVTNITNMAERGEVLTSFASHVPLTHATKLVFQYGYFKDCVDTLGSKVQVLNEGELKPLLMKDDNYKTLLMPVRVR